MFKEGLGRYLIKPDYQIKRSRKRIWLISFLLFILFVFILGKIALSPGNLKRIITYKLTSFLGVPATVGNVHLNLFSGIAVNDIRFKKGNDDDKGLFSFYVKKVHLKSKNLIRGKFEEISFKKPEIIWQTPCSLSLKGGQKEGMVLPSFNIEEGEVNILGKYSIKVDHIQARIKFLPETSEFLVSIKGQLHNDPASNFSVSGKIGSSQKRPVNLKIIWKEISLNNLFSEKKIPSCKAGGNALVIGNLTEKISITFNLNGIMEVIKGEESSFNGGGKVDYLFKEKSLLFKECSIIFNDSLSGKVSLEGKLEILENQKFSYTGEAIASKVKIPLGKNLPVISGINGKFRVVNNSLQRTPLIIEKIERPPFAIHNLKGILSYDAPIDKLNISDLSFQFCESKGEGEFNAEKISKKERRVYGSIAIKELNLEKFFHSIGKPGYITGIMETKLKFETERKKGLQIKGDFKNVPHSKTKKEISFEAVNQIGEIGSGKVSPLVRGQSLYYPYSQINGSFIVEKGYLTLIGNIKKRGKDYLLTGPIFGKSINIAIDPQNNSIRLTNLIKSFKRISGEFNSKGKK